MTRVVVPGRASEFGLPSAALLAAWADTDEFLADLPVQFGMSHMEFYGILGLRNLSGFVGEVFKHALSRHLDHLVPNPHADGRPDLLNLSTVDARRFYETKCFSSPGGSPIKGPLTPFRYGGVEVKCTLGSPPGRRGLGESRVDAVRDVSFWAHHQHACRLLGLYFDFDEPVSGRPVLRAMFIADLKAHHWRAVSTGNPTKKKTSNTSLTKDGRSLLMAGMLAYFDEPAYMELFQRLGAITSQ